MRRLILAACVLFLHAVNAPAQPASPLRLPETPWDGVATGPADPVLAWPGELAPQKTQDSFELGRRRLDVVAGLPLGLRFQVPLKSTAESAFVVEGFGGFYLIFPMAGGGVRYHREICSGWAGRLVLGPGCAMYGVYNTFANSGGWFGGGPSGWGMFAADLDIIWERTAASGGSGALGVKLGGGYLSGEQPLPLAAVFGGWQF